MTEAWRDKIYAGFLGMIAGVRLGAPVEPAFWTMEMIESVYGTLHGYVKNNGLFAADDDINGPVYFLKALTDHDLKTPLTPEQVGEAWLNYTRKERGMFWWGGIGVSTEHTAYDNLYRGIPAGQSGSSEQNGTVMAEQIGGQIFVDTWGLICPGDPKQAADYAMTAASVSHDGNGVCGARFIAACIAAAFVCDTVDQILDSGLEQIPPDCEYARVVHAVRTFHQEKPEDFRACMHYLRQQWGYENYGGLCPIISNAGVCILALLYGEGNFSRTIEIASACGWDTDCNAGNVGTILGVLCGLEGIESIYRAPINDFVVLSGISGCLNMLDVADYAKHLVEIACALQGKRVPAGVKRAPDGEFLFDFELPGSTHGFFLSDPQYNVMQHSTQRAHSGQGSLRVLFEHKDTVPACRIFQRSFCRREDFANERYMPAFSPRVYSGNECSCYVNLETSQEGVVWIQPYIRLAMSGEVICCGDQIELQKDFWCPVSFRVPDTNGDLVGEIGFLLCARAATEKWMRGFVYLDDVRIYGGSDYWIDLEKQCEEFSEVTPFTSNRCEYHLKNGQIFSRAEDGDGQIFTGNYYAEDASVYCEIVPNQGGNTGIALRAQGTQRYYGVGFGNPGFLQICKKKGRDVQVLKEMPFQWKPGVSYALRGVAKKGNISLYLNNEEILTTSDDNFSYGMVGVYQHSAGDVQIRRLHVSTSANK